MRMILISFFYFGITSLSFAQSYKRVTLTPSLTEKLVELQEFKCASIHGTVCPQGIAKLIITNSESPEDSGLCSGFLVSPRVLVTNHHCVSTRKLCDATRVIVYNGHGYEKARCARIIKAYADSRSDARRKIDFSVLELDQDIRSARELSLSRRPPVKGEKMFAWVVDHLSLTKSRITQLPCYLMGTKAGLELGNCASISGNSGSPIVNDSEDVVGTLWAGTTEDDVTEDTPLSLRRNTNAVSYATDIKHFRKYLP